MAMVVHPRACGERKPEQREAIRKNGSSPRLRGTLVCSAWRCCDATVHPRACGERRSHGASVASEAGSSPRLRGTRYSATNSACRRWFIPAPAGNARNRATRRSAITVHPRACGERKTHHLVTAHMDGSSPRLRGTPSRPLCTAIWLRFIPAPAGNARCFSSSINSVAVHPRACGERHGAKRSMSA